MSNTYVAGQKLRAVDMAYQKLWTVSSTTSSTSFGTSETVLGTSPSSTYRAGRAYKLTLRGRLLASTGALDASIAVRDTNISGFIRMSAEVYRVPALSLNYGLHSEHIIANTSGSDVTGRVLVITGATSVNTCVINASSVHPWYWTCIELGDSDDFPEAVAF